MERLKQSRYSAIQFLKASVSRKKRHFLLGLCLLIWPWTIQASTYKEALAAYTDQKYAKSYRIAVELAEIYEGKRRAKSLVMAAISALELNKEQKATRLYQAALQIDSEIELPDVVKSKRVFKFFENIKEGKTESKPLQGKIIEVISKNAFDASDIETYLPFGINQLAEGKPLTALSFGGGQIFSLYYAYDRYAQAKRIDQKLSQKTVEVIESGDYETSEYRDFRAQSFKSSSAAKKAGNIALVTALAAYAASVLEIVLNPPLELKVVDNPWTSSSSWSSLSFNGTISFQVLPVAEGEWIATLSTGL